MKHYKDTDTQQFYGIEEDGSQDFLIKPSWHEISVEHIHAQAQHDFKKANPEPEPEPIYEVEKIVEDVKTNKIIEIDAAAESAIIGGFSSSALGSPWIYPSKITDQINLQHAVIASSIPGTLKGWERKLKVSDEKGTWMELAHSAKQVHQVFSDLQYLITSSTTKKRLLELKVIQAIDIAAVEAIQW